ncbi:MAG: hypothetical protein KGJ78_07555 [Alphaproteobacteria bacterium]|nr:hypothetical protein [Alphaproteobacteria bacterium]
MKKNLLRATLVAGLSMFAVTATVTTQPAYAADEKPHISKSISSLMSDAQKALKDKDYATAIAKCKQAQATSDLSDYDHFMIDYFLGFAYFNSGDRASAGAAYADAAKIPGMPADDHRSVVHNALLLAADQNNYPRVVEVGQVADKDNTLDSTTAGQLAIAYYNLKDGANAAVYAQKSIDFATAAGKMPERAAYEVLVFTQYDKKDMTAVTKTFETMCNYYGNQDDWGHLLDLELAALSTATKTYREIAALDIYRLRLLTNATTSGDDYTTMADVATSVRSWGDAKQALEAGVAQGKLQESKVGAQLKKVSADAARDEPIMAQAEAAAAKQKSVDEDLSVGEAYYGYGRYADAARVAQRAIGKGGPRVAEARLLLGMSQVRMGDDATAAQTLASVDVDPAMDRVAHIWSLYATRKYGKTAAAPAAGGH